MEATFLNEIINGNTAVIAIAILFLYRMHKEAMVKIDTLTEAITTLAMGHAVHQEKLDTGDKKFIKLENHMAKIDQEVLRLRDRVHEMVGNMITQEQANQLIDLAYKKSGD